MFICVFINDHYQRTLNTDGYRYTYVDVDDDIFKISESLMTAKVISRAGVEIMYSSVGLVQSKLSNILGNKKAGNLYIYSNILIVDIKHTLNLLLIN